MKLDLSTKWLSLHIDIDAATLQCMMEILAWIAVEILRNALVGS